MDDAKNRKAPDEGPHGVDRWSSNGYGLRIDGIEVSPPADEEGEEE